MKQSFSVDQRNLVNVLSSMQQICGKKTALDVTSSILFQANARELILKTTDLEVSLQCSLPIESKIDDQIDFLVHGKRLFDLVRELSGSLTFTWNGKAIAIAAGMAGDRLGISLSTSNVGDFPPFPERIENLMDLDADFLSRILDRVTALIPQNNANPALNGLFIECGENGTSFVATDGHSLARIKTDQYKLAETQTWIFPKRALVEFKKTLESSDASRIFLGTCSGLLVLSGGNFNFFTRLIADKFPHYEPILEKKDFTTGSVKRDVLVGALKRAGCLLAGKFVSTKFDFSENKTLTLSLNNKEVGSLTETLELENYDGKNITTRFYSPYVLGAAQAIGSQTVTFSTKDESAPLFFESSNEDGEFIYLVMPVLEGKD
ncbi:DNA polymerase III subunit beta [Candidatus Babeliales bacterium]|nr:DNA polymerase III subunit beta [Candidatus Babeliales bacterium]